MTKEEFTEKLNEEILNGRKILKDFEELPDRRESSGFSSHGSLSAPGSVYSIYPEEKYQQLVKNLDLWEHRVQSELKSYWGVLNPEQIERFKISDLSVTLRLKSLGIRSLNKNLTTLESYIECLPYIDEENNLKSSFKSRDGLPYKVFISHSHNDGIFVEGLVDLLEFLRINSKEKLLCSSVTGYRVPLGENICDYIFKQFKNYNLIVIIVHSDAYYSSHISLNEMGAAWVVKSEIRSFLVKGFDYGKMDGVVDSVKIAIKVDEPDAKERLNELKDFLLPIFNPDGVDQTRWEGKRDAFLEKVNNL